MQNIEKTDITSHIATNTQYNLADSFKEKITKFGIYYLAEVFDPKTKLTGRGISRKSPLDKHNDELGKKIALGRAYKALKIKKSRKIVKEWCLG